MNVATTNLFFTLLTLAADAVVLVGLGTVAGSHWSQGAARLRSRLAGMLDDGGLGLAWLVAVVATAGSLWYSEVVGFVPCRLCWFQRIAMYPLAVILGIAVFTRDRRVGRYVLPLAAIGGAISAYHYVIQWFPDLEAGACSLDAPCAAFYVRELGFVSIPFMAGSAFALVITALLVGRGARSRPHDPHDPIDPLDTLDTPHAESEAA